MRRILLGGMASLLATVSLFISAAAQAQDRYFLQVEAHSTLPLALEFVERYAREFDNVVGYRLQQSGWHAIALGPFDSRQDANDLRRELQRLRAIPPDAFVTLDNRYAARFWPTEAAEGPGAESEATAEARLAAQRAAEEAEAARAAAEAALTDAAAARREADRLAAEADAERQAAEAAARAEADRLANEAAARAEAERRAAEEAERLAAEAAARAEADRLASEAAARAEAERRATEEAERLAAEAAARAEADRLASEAAARAEAERRAAEEAARLEAERLEAERLAAEAARDETLPEARRSEAQLTRDERADLQIALQWKGYYTMAIDAAFGPGTRRAFAAWQQDNGHEPTGVLTTRQRAALLESHAAEIAAYGFETIRYDRAGIEITMPTALVEFDRFEAPFAHFNARDDSGVQALLISQEGTLATLFGLYEIMQTLEIVPLEGTRERRRDSFLLTGQSDSLRSHTFAQHRNGQVKGFTLIWTPENDDRVERVLAVMQDSFTMFGPALPDGVGRPASAVQREDLLSGLEIRRPLKSRSGFYIDSTGKVLTAANMAAECTRLTIDERYEARVILRDDDLGIAVLEPGEPLAPLAFANFRLNDPAVRSEVILAGFSFEDLLTRPILTFGQFAGLVEELGGDPTLRRLALEPMAGDIGGPVFDRTGTVIGMLVPQPEPDGRMLPQDVSFIASGAAIHQRLNGNGIRPAAIQRSDDLPSEELTLLAADMTVLVSCWN